MCSDTTRRPDSLVFGTEIINGLVEVPFECVRIKAYNGTRRIHNLKNHTTCRYGKLFSTKNY